MIYELIISSYCNSNGNHSIIGWKCWVCIQNVFLSTQWPGYLVYTQLQNGQESTVMNGLIHIGRGMKMNPGMFCIHTFGEYVFVGEYAQIIQIMHGWFVILYLWLLKCLTQRHWMDFFMVSDLTRTWMEHRGNCVL